MIVTPYFDELIGIKFGKICLSPPSRCRGVSWLMHTLMTLNMLKTRCNEVSNRNVKIMSPGKIPIMNGKYDICRLVSWVVSNCEKAPSMRMEFVQSLQKYIDIDIYGM